MHAIDKPGLPWPRLLHLLFQYETTLSLISGERRDINIQSEHDCPSGASKVLHHIFFACSDFGGRKKKSFADCHWPCCLVMELEERNTVKVSLLSCNVPQFVAGQHEVDNEQIQVNLIQFDKDTASP